MTRFNPSVNDPLREYGHWSYVTGTGTATVNVPTDYRVTGIAVVAPSGGASLVIGSGGAIAIPAGDSVALEPKGNLQGPVSLVIDSSTGYMVEMVDWLPH